MSRTQVLRVYSQPGFPDTPSGCGFNLPCRALGQQGRYKTMAIATLFDERQFLMPGIERVNRGDRLDGVGILLSWIYSFYSGYYVESCENDNSVVL